MYTISPRRRKKKSWIFALLLFSLFRLPYVFAVSKCFAKHLNDVKRREKKKQIKANGRLFIYLTGRNEIYVNKDTSPSGDIYRIKK